MKKVYLLLRNNHERGPFTVEELLQQHLRPTDLVWVEGWSQAWSYPSEIPELRPFFGGAPYTLPSVHYQLTGTSHNDDIELRAEEIRQKILSFTPKYYTSQTRQQKPIQDSRIPIPKEDEIEFIDHRKKETHAFEWLSSAMVTLVVVAGFFGGQRFILGKKHTGNSVVTRSVNADTHAAKSFAGKPIIKPQATMLPSIDSTATVQDSLETTTKHTVAISMKTPKPKDTAKKLVVKDTVTNNVAVTEVAPPVLAEPEPNSVDHAKKDTVIQAPEEKKKTLGQVLKGLFKKKKKYQEQPANPTPDSSSNQ